MAKPLHIAALTAQIETASAELQLLPAGDFRARDGRPVECAAWHMDATIADVLIAAAAARDVPYCIDYEHQTLNAATNGQPAPAAAWFKTLEWRAGDGLYAVDVEWTERAAAMIAAKEYRYLSPVFGYDKAGNVEFLLNAALTNNPALDCLDEVQLAAASVMAASLSATAGALPAESHDEEKPTMDELLEQLRWMLNMPVGATVEEIKDQLKKLIDTLSGGQGVAAASVNLPVMLDSQRQQIAALSANQVDPAKFVSVSVMTDLRAQLDAANAKIAGREVDELVTVALSDGRLLPAQETWARDLGKANVAALSAFLTTAQKIPALSGTQTGGAAPANDAKPEGQLDEASLAVCKAMGITPQAYAKTNGIGQ